MIFSMTGQEKGDLFNTGGDLIEVTIWADLTVYCLGIYYHSRHIINTVYLILNISITISQLKKPQTNANLNYVSKFHNNVDH